MSFPFTPKISYGPGPTILSLSLSAGTLAVDREHIGGSSESGAGVPESYTVRKKGLLTVQLKFTEAEVASIVAWLDWVMDNGSLGFFDFYPDQSVGTHYTCYLIKPAANSRYGIKRKQDYLKVYELDVELRTTNNAMFDVRL